MIIININNLLNNNNKLNNAFLQDYDHKLIQI